MTDDRIQLRKLTPTIGAEIFGVDLARPLSGAQVADIRRGLLENLVIFFRDQKLTSAELKRAGAYFGELVAHPVIPGEIAQHPEILVLKTDENTKSVGEIWHTDISCETEPPLGSMLYMLEVPANGGGDTMFASMYAAYDELSEPMKRFLDPLTAIHDGGPTYTNLDRLDDETKRRAMPVTEHPVVRTHPETGRKSLFVNLVYTKRIVQLEQDESDALLQFLFGHVEKSHLHCRFKWAAGSIAFWDNRCTQHLPVWDYKGYRRHAHRITLRGDRPFHQP